MIQAYTAKEAKAFADAQLATWRGAPDAFLSDVFTPIGAKGAPEFPLDKVTGRSAVWRLFYYSPTIRRGLEVHVLQGTVRTKELKRFGFKMPPEPLPAAWLDSPEVVAAAENQGGAQLGEDRRLSLWLPASEDPDAQNPPPQVCWAALYFVEFPPAQPGDVAYFYIDAHSGELLGREDL